MSRSACTAQALLLFEAALYLYENMLQKNRLLVLNTDEIIIMKIHYEMATCLEKLGKVRSFYKYFLF